MSMCLASSDVLQIYAAFPLSHQVLRNKGSWRGREGLVTRIVRERGVWGNACLEWRMPSVQLKWRVARIGLEICNWTS